MNPQPLAGRVAIVTGGARGIGYGIAHRFAEEGADIAIADINAELAETSAATIRAETGRRALAIACDVTDRASVDATVQRTCAELGGLDIMMANAGICPFVDFLDLDVATWQRTIDVILTGSFHCAQAAARTMIAQGRGGRIIFTTSLATIAASSGQADYAAAKGGVKMLMASVATGLGKHRITVNAVAPGVIYTEMGAFHWDIPENREAFAKTNPIGRLGTPADIAAAAVFLASDDAVYITGSTIRVDGGNLCIG
jgi:NAD(P)-dependent dehydrogenase (short-subunit alcohol dehydrogenase family)